MKGPEPDALGARCGRGERDGRRRDRIVRPMMLAEAEDVEDDPVGELDLLQDVGELLSTSTGSPVSGSRRVSTKA
jgi:hypothetical protein